jgi:hypothetical protein
MSYSSSDEESYSSDEIRKTKKGPSIQRQSAPLLFEESPQPKECLEVVLRELMKLEPHYLMFDIGGKIKDSDINLGPKDSSVFYINYSKADTKCAIQIVRILVRLAWILFPCQVGHINKFKNFVSLLSYDVATKACPREIKISNKDTEFGFDKMLLYTIKTGKTGMFF